MSLLTAHGHSEAVSYPVAMLMDEASIVSQRVASEQAAAGLVFQAALGTVPNMGVKASSTQKAHTGFRKLIDMLTGATGGQ